MIHNRTDISFEIILGERKGETKRGRERGTFTDYSPHKRSLAEPL